ncbi:hypothetical protein OHA79_28915 [Streptomyces sp. NBC_00841]|uniref:hypothetical protein n=1 Tax=unclassified Streptomyces TaxID=2593676 RepID=UPI00225A11B6|nr:MULTISPECIES: hypothetical protein [unclassified Streptomyces]MCX4533044.1 hypothetical protein [Streptomyces sp. NBC_01669]WSA01507.1 hypothetical protein OHA79_28915 [Streptomyces sp. NBC_00841]
MAASGASSKRFGGLGRWWGVLAGALLIAAWINSAAGPAVVIALSAAVLLWCFFQAPVTCGAPVRGRTDGCRNNASGLLLGCHIRQHLWQKLKLLIVRRQLREFCSGLFSDGKATIVTLAGAGSFVSGLVALIPGVVVH